MKYFAGIGNRDINWDTRQDLQKRARAYAMEGFILRSGGADGADKAFESGVGGYPKEILKAKDATEEAIELASTFHPAWDKCTDYAKKLHGRNAMIILGPDLKTPVEFVVCYAANEQRGGTALGIRIARAHNIPVHNVFNEGENA